MIDLTPLVNAVIAVAAALITAFLLPWLKRKLAAERRQDIAYWLTVAVEAAEEYFAGSGRGEEKAAFVREFLAARGWKLNEQEASALINSTVWALIHNMEGEWAQ